MTEEVDFALQYAEERRKRLKAEQRLYSYIHETAPYVSAVEKLLKGLVRNDADLMADSMSKLFDWQADMEIQTFLNILKPHDPAVFSGLEGFDINSIEDPEKIPLEVRDHYHEVICAAAKVGYEEWKQLATVRGYASRDQMRNQFRRKLHSNMKVTMKAMMARSATKENPEIIKVNTGKEPTT